ncbi:MAG: HIT family hydrolase [Omnitrophica bacterium RIFCSPLOWO2_12_FULL_44_17]|uniref:HIT family hydrolase n=1 Tax=Candidatus Danuiimicrobium aquiferis TaxID=1801832 RepID=A0A1G1L0P1_9BACT|nr:MAG: HIT family hydrolase [Omnitrophica bacterium RIFCSPHIGHO2_02_FULL_45_28]OGW89863.1 MAG: HIT family hydrolase [Omnitrophica bacterium RIFCSPHIGHO2_12_FULL_44_12]OGW98714.1 MAG: HIT family hydrolase [Omnitrophica bacterium RIFCSPLOWO2_12_FULL_44_17]OGX03105.1 MAG: HIT family hydrolase [Omnitrophica bacterium RIFCSPLOWO2_02_FULL_44_11]
MKRLWAPWRKKYITEGTGKGCFLCRARRSRKDRESFIIARSKSSFAVLNIYPYNNGHVLVVPNRHVAVLSALKDNELLDLTRLCDKAMNKITKVMKAQGINLGVNFGYAAGAGLPGHLHIHIVPRWVGDTNYMPVIGETKVISDSLQAVYESLKMS